MIRILPSGAGASFLGIAPGRTCALLAAAVLAACSPSQSNSSQVYQGAGGQSGQDDGALQLNAQGGGTTLFVSGPQGGPFPDGERRIEVVNAGDRPIDWVLRTDVDWLLASQAEGSLDPGDSDPVIVGIDQAVASTLPVGSYLSSIVLLEPGGTESAYLAFQLDVLAAGGVVQVDPAEGFEARGVEGSAQVTPGSKTYVVRNVGSDSIEWRIAATRPWVRFVPTAYGDLEPGEEIEIEAVLVGQEIQQLAAGTHEAQVRVINRTNGLGNTTFEVSLELDAQGGRVTTGLVSLYDFEEFGGTTIYDRSGVAPALDLTVQDENRVSWVAGALSIDQATRLTSSGPATKIVDRCKATGEVTLELWMSPDNLTQEGPARLLSLSDGATERNFTLGQGLWGDLPSDSFNVRLRTTQTDMDGMPMLDTGAGAAKMGLTHVVYTRAADGTAYLYVDGQSVGQTSVGGNLSNWDQDYVLTLANEVGVERPWLGRLHLAAVFERALDASEVWQNFSVGTGDAQYGDLSVTPSTSFLTGGVPGGPFEPEEKVYTLSNVGDDDLTFEVSADAAWITLSQEEATLAPGQSLDLVVGLDTTQVAGFSEGTFTGTLTITNVDTGIGSTTRNVRLEVNQNGGNQGGGTGWTWETSVTRGGITWFFDGQYKVGQFVNGDYWVEGPVTIESISPPSVMVGGRAINGSMVNPAPGKAHGYDSTLFGSWAGDNYNSSLNVALGLTPSNPLVLGANNSLVSTISPAETAYFPPGIEFAAVLTVLPEPPMDGSFRPPYTGTNKPLYNVNQLELGLLADLPVVSGMPNPSAMAQKFEHVWLDHVDGWLGRFLHPAQNMPDYGREMSTEIGKASLLLHQDLPFESKFPLLVRLVQVGIDFDGLFQNGQSWVPAGGHTVGRKWPIMFKRAMLGEQPRLNASVTRFSEDGQTFVVQQTSPGVYNNGYGGYGPGQLGMPEWGEYYWVQSPIGSDGFFNWGENNYRTCCTYNTSAGHFLSAMIMGLRSSWDWEPAFGYMDRYMQVESGWTRQMDGWTASMWDTYRQDFPGYQQIPSSWYPPGL